MGRTLISRLGLTAGLTLLVAFLLAALVGAAALVAGRPRIAARTTGTFAAPAAPAATAPSTPAPAVRAGVAPATQVSIYLVGTQEQATFELQQLEIANQLRGLGEPPSQDLVIVAGSTSEVDHLISAAAVPWARIVDLR